MAVLAAPVTLLRQRRIGQEFILRLQPFVAVGMAQRLSKGTDRIHPILGHSGAIEVGNAFVQVNGDHGIAQLVEQVSLKLPLRSLGAACLAIFAAAGRADIGSYGHNGSFNKKRYKVALLYPPNGGFTNYECGWQVQNTTTDLGSNGFISA